MKPFTLSKQVEKITTRIHTQADVLLKSFCRPAH